MPVYEYYCEKCQREVTLTLTIREHETSKVMCPNCGSNALRPRLSTFVSQTRGNPDDPTVSTGGMA